VDGDVVTWHGNFKTQVAAVAATVGLATSDVDAVTADNTSLNAKVTALNTAKTAQQAAAADKATTFRNVIARSRSVANRIKAHPNYTEAIGRQLGIIGPEDTTDLSQAKPTLRAEAVTAGSVRIGFNKSVSSGVRIFSKRGAETTFTFLATDTESPYIDTRPNLAPGPETRQYQAHYIVGDDPTGQMSDILQVVVPG
jgi:hypothetical protein